jgi:hypothetical protein
MCAERATARFVPRAALATCTYCVIESFLAGVRSHAPAFAGSRDDAIGACRSVGTATIDAPSHPPLTATARVEDTDG